MVKIKYRGTHNTLIPFAREVANIITPLGVSISPGIISPVRTSSRSVKIVRAQGWCLLAAKQSATVQELRVFHKELRPQELMVAVARALRNEGIAISF